MQAQKRQFAYFETLEWTIKLGLTSYLLLLCGESAAVIYRIDRTVDFFSSAPAHVWGIVIGIFLAVFLLILFAVGRIDWLGELHIRLDRTLFGFLSKSNDVIFDELASSLLPGERRSVRSIHSGEKGSLAKSIFSYLASDNSLFEQLLSSGIFQYWIWYWVTIYGTFVFSILTTESFLALLLVHDPYVKIVFAIDWIAALAHLSMSLILGYYLLRMTRESVSEIVQSRGSEIASILRTKIEQQQIVL
jgi:hypothetical protein